MVKCKIVSCRSMQKCGKLCCPVISAHKRDGPSLIPDASLCVVSVGAVTGEAQEDFFTS
jgi:hypothetical protein